MEAMKGYRIPPPPPPSHTLHRSVASLPRLGHRSSPNHENKSTLMAIMELVNCLAGREIFIPKQVYLWGRVSTSCWDQNVFFTKM